MSLCGAKRFHISLKSIMGAGFSVPHAFDRPADPRVIAACANLSKSIDCLHGWSPHDVVAVWEALRQKDVQHGVTSWLEFLSVFEGHAQVCHVFL